MQQDNAVINIGINQTLFFLNIFLAPFHFQLACLFTPLNDWIEVYQFRAKTSTRIIDYQLKGLYGGTKMQKQQGSTKRFSLF